MKIPAIIVIVILLVFEHVGDALRASRATTIDFAVYVTSVIMIVIAILCLLHFVINGVRVLRFLHNLGETVATRSGHALTRVRL
jgi:hypothetical protein